MYNDMRNWIGSNAPLLEIPVVAKESVRQTQSLYEKNRPQ